MDRTPKDILDALGGYRAVAADLGEAHQTVHNWTRRTIPAKHWHKLIAKAEKLGIELKIADLEGAKAAPSDFAEVA